LSRFAEYNAALSGVCLFTDNSW